MGADRAFDHGGVAAGWTTLRVRLTGLESVLGNAIAATWWPRSAEVDPQRFSADLNRDAGYESEAEGVSVKVNYDQTFSAADPFRFSLSNYATATLTADSPIGVDEWVRAWIDPLVALISLATGERERINTVTLSAPDPTPHHRVADMTPEVKAQLWGGGIHQQDQAAERRTRPDGSPLVPLFTLADAPPLAELIRRWRASVADQTAASLYRLAMDRTSQPKCDISSTPRLSSPWTPALQRQRSSRRTNSMQTAERLCLKRLEPWTTTCLTLSR